MLPCNLNVDAGSYVYVKVRVNANGRSKKRDVLHEFCKLPHISNPVQWCKGRRRHLLDSIFLPSSLSWRHCRVVGAIRRSK